MLGRKVMYVRCINCSYNNGAKGIRLLDKKAIFCLYRKKFMQVRAFERYIPLNTWKLNVLKMIDSRILFYCNDLDRLSPKPKFTFRVQEFQKSLFSHLQIKLLTML